VGVHRRVGGVVGRELRRRCGESGVPGPARRERPGSSRIKLTPFGETRYAAGIYWRATVISIRSCRSSGALNGLASSGETGSRRNGSDRLIVDAQNTSGKRASTGRYSSAPIRTRSSAAASTGCVPGACSPSLRRRRRRQSHSTRGTTRHRREPHTARRVVLRGRWRSRPREHCYPSRYSRAKTASDASARRTAADCRSRREGREDRGPELKSGPSGFTLTRTDSPFAILPRSPSIGCGREVPSETASCRTA
jgi:hypothetical protein